MRVLHQVDDRVTISSQKALCGHAQDIDLESERSDFHWKLLSRPDLARTTSIFYILFRLRDSDQEVFWVVSCCPINLKFCVEVLPWLFLRLNGVIGVWLIITHVDYFSYLLYYLNTIYACLFLHFINLVVVDC